MAILASASTTEVARLLELFPVSHLRSTWPNHAEKHKRELCEAVAASEQYGAVATFVDAVFGTARQHVYVFDRPGGKNKPAAPSAVLDGETIATEGGRRVYASRMVRDVLVLRPDGIAQEQLQFLWPIRVDTLPKNVVVRFVVLEKNVKTFFEHPAYATGKGISEADVLAGLMQDMSLTACDLHSGTKKLWKSGFMDAHQADYTLPDSTVSQTMHDEKGIRVNKPELFKELMKCPLGRMRFRVDGSKRSSVGEFLANPSEGFLAFLRACQEITIRSCLY
jgi:hypothetical protein